MGVSRKAKHFIESGIGQTNLFTARKLLASPNVSRGKTGKASLSQDNDDEPTIQLVPDGFKAVVTEHGSDFRCLICDVAVEL